VPPFETPLFLLPIYRAAEAVYGVPWQVLAAINSIESDFGRNPGVSSAGARGWMQFMPQTWSAYGTDANRDGAADPYNPIDAVFSAARYLRAAGAEEDLRAAIYAYNHAGWYVQAVLARADAIERSAAQGADELTALAGGRVPVASPARWQAAGSESSPAATIHARPGSAVVAVTDGVIVDIGRSSRSGRYVVTQDASGDRYVYSGLGSVAASRPVAPHGRTAPGGHRRLFAHPLRRRTRAVGGWEQAIKWGDPPVRRGTILGRVGGETPGAGQIRFAIRPAGGAPRIDPLPFLDGWRRLKAAGAFRPSGRSVLDAAVGERSVERMLTLPPSLLERRLLADQRVTIYPCGRADVAAGRIDRRVIVTLELLAESGLYPTVSSLECGHSRLTASGNVSEHSTGDAVDIAAINDVSILGHQGSDSVAATTVRRLASLRGQLRPHQIISLMTLPGAGNTMALRDHDDHIHVGFHPRREARAPLGRRIPVGLDAGQWRLLTAQLSKIRNPAVRAPVIARRAWLRAHAQARHGAGAR
jgi:hypothetical protein